MCQINDNFLLTPNKNNLLLLKKIMKNLLIASTSTIFNGAYLEYLFDDLKLLFAKCETVLFIPYARPDGISHNDYTLKAIEAFLKINLNVVGLHEFENPIKAIQNAEAIFVGGGNTFLLVHQLYQYNLIAQLQKSILQGTPYLGTSAGSNIAGVSMQTTNDMPIIYPQSFETLGILPFNLNPHYLDVDAQSQHMGETRETRIKEFHVFNDVPVLGLREGSWLDVKGDDIILKGTLTASLFLKNECAQEVQPETNLKFLHKKSPTN